MKMIWGVAVGCSGMWFVGVLECFWWVFVGVLLSFSIVLSLPI